jgi:hypothetical protein
MHDTLTERRIRVILAVSVDLKGYADVLARFETYLAQQVPNWFQSGGAHTMSQSTDYTIGGLDAWRDDRDRVQAAFVPVEQFTQLIERHRCLLAGRRGSGKSAIAIMSKQAPNWGYCDVLEGEASQYGAYIQLVEELVARQYLGLQVDVKRCSELLWRYVLRVAILQSIAANVTPPGDDPSALDDIELFLRVNNHWQKKVGEILHDVFQDAIAVLPPDARGALDLYTALFRRCSAPGFPEATAAIPRLLKNKSLLLVIDTLESYKIQSEAMKQGLRGIIAAILGLSSDREFAGTGLRFFVPAEIFDDVSIDMPGKVIGSTVFLRWRTGDLLTMLTKRFLEMLQRHQLIDSAKSRSLTELVEAATSRTVHGGDGRMLRDKFWYENNFLPRRVQNNYNFEEDCFAYIFRHTQRRPRELIFVLNKIIEHARNDLPKISAESVREGIHDPVTLQVLLNDQLSPYQGYVDAIVDRARSVFYQHARLFNGSQLRQFAKAFYELGPVPDIDVDGFVGFLLRSGVIGLVKDLDGYSRTKGRYCTGRFEYIMQGHLPLNPELVYCVHPAMGDHFKMEVNPELGAVYPEPEGDTWLEESLGLQPSA